jgi:hypothetical protein
MVARSLLLQRGISGCHLALADISEAGLAETAGLLKSAKPAATVVKGRR